MKLKFLRAAGLMLLAAVPTLAQQMTGGITANGQVHLASGQPVRQEVRLYVEMDSARRPPFYVYTDLMGRFIITELRPLATYRITIETDEQNWETTTFSFIPSGQNPRVDVFLLPLRRTPVVAGAAGSVSVNTLQQRVPSDARKEFEQGVQLIKKNDFTRAWARFEQAVAIFPQYVDARNELAVILMRENQLDAAEEQLRIALQVDSVAVRPLMNLGLCLSRQEKWEEANEVLDKAVQLAPAEPNGHLLLGVALVKLGKAQEAETQLKRAYELGGKKAAQAQYYLASLYMQQKDYPRAITALETYLHDNPDDPSAPRLRTRLEQLRAAGKP